MEIMICCATLAAIPLGLWIFHLHDELAYQRRMATVWYKQAEHFREKYEETLYELEGERWNEVDW